MSGGWMASYVVLWAAVAMLLVMVLALVRQIGVLHGRLDDAGSGTSVRDSAAAAEGPPLGAAAPLGAKIGYDRAPVTLVAFTSASCELSQVLAPALRVVDKQYDNVRVVELVLGPRTIAAFEAFNVLHTPFVVAVGQDGRVRGRGRARNLPQLEAFVDRAVAVAAKAAGVPVPPAQSRPAASAAPADVVVLTSRQPEPVAPVEPVAAVESVGPVESVAAVESEPVEADPARAGV